MSAIVERWIMVKVADDHIIMPHDSIDEPVLTHHGVVVMAGNLACNVGAVGKLAREFISAGRQVWTGRLMLVSGGKIVSREVAA